MNIVFMEPLLLMFTFLISIFERLVYHFANGKYRFEFPERFQSDFGNTLVPQDTCSEYPGRTYYIYTYTFTHPYIPYIHESAVREHRNRC